jgi:ubiquinone/menaquinone biosynthesis C-methylase UbiE
MTAIAMPSGFSTVTEIPGTGATQEQIAMLRTRYDLAARLAEGKEVLEVACGTGPGLGYMARRALRVVGGDYDEDLIQQARDHYRDRIELHQLDAKNLPFRRVSFDVVVLLEAIYYLPQAEKFLAEARRVLRPGGTLYLCSANREWTLFHPSPYSRRYYSADELRCLLERAGFQAELFAGFPDQSQGLKSRLFRALRKTAVSWNLIPQTMNGKEIIKRLLYGKLTPLPAELTDSIGEVHPLVPIQKGQAVYGHKVLYAVGRLS